MAELDKAEQAGVGPSNVTSDADDQQSGLHIIRICKGLIIAFIAVVFEVLSAFLPLYTSESNSFSILDYSVLSQILVPFLIANVLWWLALCLVVFLRVVWGPSTRCCSYACCISLSTSVLAFVTAMFFIVLCPAAMGLIFGGPNQLGDDLRYSLGAGYYLDALAKLLAAFACIVCFFELRWSASAAFSRRHSRMCLLLLAIGSMLGLIWTIYILSREYSGKCSSVDVGNIRMPPGFSISVFAKVPGARSIVRAPDDIVIVSTRKQGVVYAVGIKDGNVKTIFSGGDQPNGVAYRDDFLYIAEVSRVLRYSWNDVKMSMESGVPLTGLDGTKIADYPTERHHGWRYARFGPDGLLYIAVGAPCNICYEKDFASITALNVSDYNKTIIAKGVRNSVGFDFEEGTGNLWFTDNGGDWLGDDIPPDELNKIINMRSSPPPHFGFPHCYGSGTSYGEKFNPTGNCDEYIAAKVELGPHVAALGMRFYPSSLPSTSQSRFPKEYWGKIFIAEHGSWNRREPIGYRVTVVNGNGFEEFATGFLQNGQACGRPVDIEMLDDGSMLVSDDKDDSLFRITYRG